MQLDRPKKNKNRMQLGLDLMLLFPEFSVFRLNQDLFDKQDVAANLEYC